MVYDDSSLEHDQVMDILKFKAGLSHYLPDSRMNSNLVTMMLPSCLYSRDGADAINATKIKILDYTYLNFNHYKHSLNDD